jgi:hypothetical protein
VGRAGFCIWYWVKEQGVGTGVRNKTGAVRRGLKRKCYRWFKLTKRKGGGYRSRSLNRCRVAVAVSYFRSTWAWRRGRIGEEEGDGVVRSLVESRRCGPGES